MPVDPPNDEETIFHTARAISSPEARAAYLASACADRAPLRARVVALLKVYESEPSSDGPVPPAATELLDQMLPPVDELVGTVIGRYRLVGRLGEGGFGVVFMAEQLTPVCRKVALKVIKPGLDTRQVIARFAAERQALAMMDHENIAKVLDAGATEAGRPYFVMELVDGVPLTDYCDANRLSIRDRLELFVRVCRAVQHAHTKGVIHRDIKPTNVLVTVHDGAPVPKVIDFGVAKATGPERLSEGTQFTHFAQMVGTPLYMSPEQAEMKSVDVDTRSDVYSLGVLLYELVTGTTPFEKERLRQASPDEVRRIVREDEPPKPSSRIVGLGEKLAEVSFNRRSDPQRLGRRVRGELDWIAMRSLEKDRDRRYETATALARDVERYLADEPVQACPPSGAYRFRKFARRNKATLLTVVATAAVLVLAAGVSLRQAERARGAERDAKVAAAEAKRSSAELALDKAQLLGESGDANLSLIWLARSLTLAPADAVDLRSAIRRSLSGWREHVNAMRVFLPSDGGVYAVAYAPDGRLLTASWESGTNVVRVEHWDPVSGGPLKKTNVPGQLSLRCVAFSPDAATILLGLLDGRFQLVSLDTGNVLWEGRSNGGFAASVAFSADGRIVLIGYEMGSTGARGPTGRAQAFDAATGVPLGPALDHRRPVRAVAFHPDGKTFVTECGLWGNASERVEARFWDLRGHEVRPSLAHACIAISVAFSPDGKTLATGHWDRTALLWNLAAEKEPVVLQHEGPVATVAFSHDGKALLTGAFDGAVRIWDTNGRILGPPLRQGHLVDTAVFDPNDKSVLVATRGNVARVWDLAPGAGRRAKQSQESTSFPLAASPDCRTILTRETEHTTVIRDAATLQPVGASLPHDGPIVIGGTSVLPGRRHACSSDRRRVVTVDPDDVVKLWDARTGKLIAELQADDDPPIFYTAAFSPDGKLAVTGRDNYSAEVWDAGTGTFLRRLPHGPTGGVFAVAFAPDGKTLLTGSANAASFWNPSTGGLLGPPLVHHTVVLAAAYRPDGKMVATGDAEQNVQLWDVSTRARLRHLPGHRGGVNDVTFSPDGRSILTASSDHTARLWDVATGKPIGPPMPHDGPVVRAAFARDGTLIQTATQDQRTFSWHVPLPMDGSTEHLERWAQVVTGMELAADGGIRVLDAATWESRRQALKTSD